MARLGILLAAATIALSACGEPQASETDGAQDTAASGASGIAVPRVAANTIDFLTLE